MLASKKLACRAVPSYVRVSVMRGPEARKPREDLTVPGGSGRFLRKEHRPLEL